MIVVEVGCQGCPGHGRGDNGLRFHLHALPAHFRGDHQPQRRAQGAAVPGGDVLRQLGQPWRQGGIVLQAGVDIADAFVRQVSRFAEAQHPALLAGRAERHAHAPAGADGHALRHPVGEQPVHLADGDVHDHLGVQAAPPVFRAARISLRITFAASFLLIMGNSLAPSRVMTVMMLVSTSKPAPGRVTSLAMIMSRRLRPSFSRACSVTFSVSAANPAMN